MLYRANWPLRTLHSSAYCCDGGAALEIGALFNESKTVRVGGASPCEPCEGAKTLLILLQ